MSPSGSLPGFRESARDLPGVCQALAESRKAQSLASKISKAFMGRLGKTWEDLKPQWEDPGRRVAIMGRFHGKAWEGAGRHGKRFGKGFPWEGLPPGDQPSATLPAFPGKGGVINPIYGLLAERPSRRS